MKQIQLLFLIVPFENMPVVTRAQKKRQAEAEALKEVEERRKQQQEEQEPFDELKLLKELKEHCIENCDEFKDTFKAIIQPPCIYRFPRCVLDSAHSMIRIERAFSHNVNYLLNWVEQQQTKKMRIIGSLILFRMLNHILLSLLGYNYHKYKKFAETILAKCIEIETNRTLIDEVQNDEMTANLMETIKLTKETIEITINYMSDGVLPIGNIMHWK